MRLSHPSILILRQKREKEFAITEAHIPPLISDLAIILIVAGVVTLLFKKMNRPVVLGYILAGLLVGPEVSFLPTVHDKEAIQIWADIGVIFLLFGLGLEVNLKKLAEVGFGSGVTSLIQVLAMIGIGYGVGALLGWSPMDGLFLGGMLAISSTMIVIKAVDDLGYKQKKFMNLVLGVLIVEDLFAILILVLLTTISISNQFQGKELLLSSSKLIFFITICFIGGMFFIPWILRKFRSILNEETRLIFSLGLCLLMVLLATKSGFSPALGAFVMGIILSKTPEGERIEETLLPVKNLFAAIFFVSVGMLIDLEMFKIHWFSIIVVSIVTIIGKGLSTTFGALLSGQNLKDSVQSGMSLAQIGEFSFIIATLGLSLNVTSDFLYPIVVAVSVITTFTTPYLISYSEKTYQLIESKIPKSWHKRLSQNFSELPYLKSMQKLKSVFIKIFMNTMIIIAISLSSSKYLVPLILQEFDRPIVASNIALMVTVILCLPFWWAILLRSEDEGFKFSALDDLKQLTFRAILGLAARTVWAFFLLTVVMSQFLSATMSFALVGGLAAIVGLLGLKNFTKIYDRLEKRFLGHLNEKEILHLTKRKIPLAPMNAYFSTIEIDPNSSMVGKSIKSLAVRKSFGVTIAVLKRGKMQTSLPKPETIIMPYDELTIIGTDESISKFSEATKVELTFETSQFHPSTDDELPITLRPQVIDADCAHLGKSIFECTKTLGFIVGIERADGQVVAPDANVQLSLNDRIWLVEQLDS